MSIHDGHRQRLKERFVKEGLDNFQPNQVLELVLFYCIPRRDTNEIAHHLLKRFGSLSGVVEATVDELEKVPGMGENAAIFLSLLSAFSRYYQVNRASNEEKFTTIKNCGKYMMAKFSGKRNETVFLLCLDAKGKMICCREVGEGSVNSASVPIRRIVEIALGVNASSVVLAHNHPSGVAIPSADDVHTTKRLAQALQAGDILLADHLVVADDDYVSLADSGMFKPNAQYTLI